MDRRKEHAALSHNEHEPDGQSVNEQRIAIVRACLHSEACCERQRGVDLPMLVYRCDIPAMGGQSCPVFDGRLDGCNAHEPFDAPGQ